MCATISTTLPDELWYFVLENLLLSYTDGAQYARVCKQLRRVTQDQPAYWRRHNLRPCTLVELDSLGHRLRSARGRLVEILLDLPSEWSQQQIGAALTLVRQHLHHTRLLDLKLNIGHAPALWYCLHSAESVDALESLSLGLGDGSACARPSPVVPSFVLTRMSHLVSLSLKNLQLDAASGTILLPQLREFRYGYDPTVISEMIDVRAFAPGPKHLTLETVERTLVTSSLALDPVSWANLHHLELSILGQFSTDELTAFFAAIAEVPEVHILHPTGRGFNALWNHLKGELRLELRADMFHGPMTATWSEQSQVAALQAPPRRPRLRSFFGPTCSWRFVLPGRRATSLLRWEQAVDRVAVLRAPIGLIEDMAREFEGGRLTRQLKVIEVVWGDVYTPSIDRERLAARQSARCDALQELRIVGCPGRGGSAVTPGAIVNIAQRLAAILDVSARIPLLMTMGHDIVMDDSDGYPDQWTLFFPMRSIGSAAFVIVVAKTDELFHCS